MPTDHASDRVCQGNLEQQRTRWSFTRCQRPLILGILLAVVLFAHVRPALAAVTVTVSPASAQVTTGGTQQFTATVTGSGNQVVTWSTSGPGCSGMTCGSVTGGGLYTAPATAPNPATVYVKATSLADPSVSGTATVQVVSPAPIQVTLTPTVVTLGPGGTQQFTATVTGSKDTGVVWNISGSGCVGFYCGGITYNGLYTAPSQIPNPPTVTVKASAHADPTKFATATVTLATPITVTVAPGSVQLLLSQQQQFSATVTGTGNTSVVWSVSGAGCSGAACGTITQSGLYTAPSTMTSPPNVTVTATSVVDSTKAGKAAVTLVPTVAVTVSPTSIHVAQGAKQQFSAVVSGTGNQVVVWNLSGTGCSGTACGQISGSGLYTAPATIPNPNVVNVTATSVAYPTKSGTATVYVGPGSPVVVTVSPSSANVIVGQTQQFTAQVTGTSNTTVTWSVSGIGCTGQTCGTVSQSGLYTAPATAPTPSSVSVTATSQADPTRSASSIVNIVPNVVITVSPTAAQVTTGQQAQFTATVTGSNNTNVTWSLSGKGCSGKSCGTITTAGLYTAPSQVPSPAQVTVTATAQADPSKSASATVTVILPISVTVSPQNAQVVINSQQQFVATVTGTSNTSVTWSLSASSCPNSCGTINSSGLYTAPAAVPASAITVIATSQADGKTAGSAKVQVIPRNEIKLNGQYAFLFRGTNGSGFYQASGSFVADGQGNILSGIEDVNQTSGPALGVAFSGTYSMHGDNRGVMNLTTAQGTLSYAFALSSDSTVARMIEIDSSGIRGDGVFKRQDPKAFSNSALAGGYTVNFIGVDSGGSRFGALASIFPSGGGAISGSSLDANDAGFVPATFISFSGNYNVTANGRGTLSLSVPNFAGGKFNFSIYVVSASEFFLLSTDVLSSANPLFSGDALLQSGAPFSNSTFNGHSIFYQTGVTTGAPDVSVGLITFDGHGTINMQVDENAGGTVQIGQVLSGGYAVSLNGRTVLNLVNQQTHRSSTVTMYAISPNSAFIMDMTGSVRSGYLEPQVVVPPFGDSDLVGNYTFASWNGTGSATPFLSGVVNFDGNGNFSGNEDLNLSTGSSLSQLLSGTYSVSPSSQNGRGVILQNMPQAETIAIWLASYSRAYGIPVDASDVAPTVLIFQQ